MYDRGIKQFCGIERCQGRKEISDVTGIGVSNMRKYVVELEKIGMIKCTILRKHDESGFKTIHEFTVLHIKILHDKRELVHRLKSKIKN